MSLSKQNCRIWGDENKDTVEKPMYPKRVTAWCDIWAEGIIGPFFSKMIPKMMLL